MTLSSESVKVQYSGNGSTVAFAVSFIFWDDDDLRVIHRSAAGVETVWTRGTQYTVTGGNGTTGTLNVSTSPTDYTPASGTTLTIKSALADTQPTDLPLGGAFPSASVEEQLDKTVRLVQQKEERLNRAILLQETSTASDITVPDPEAGKFLRWNTDEDGIENADITGSGSIGVPVSIANGGTNSTTAATARTALAVPGLAENNTYTGTQTMSGKSFYQAEGATVASGTAPSASAIWAGDGDTIHMSGTTTQTGFAAAPQAGVWKRIILDGAISFTHSANLNCQGGVNFTGAAGDLVLVYADTTTQFDLYFLKASGAPVVPGRLVQVVSSQDGAVATGTTVMPSDDTIPQNNEGDQYLSLAITPSNASNILEIDVIVNATNSAGGTMLTAALFQDSTANALAAGYDYLDTGGTSRQIVFKHRMVAGTASATTFKVRIGNSGAGTTTFNGVGGARKLGGVVASSITIKEITV